VTGLGIAGSDEDRGRSRRLGTEDWGWSSTSRVLDGRTIERLGEPVCGLHHAIGDEEHEFLSLTSKLRSTVSPGLASKPVATALMVWPQNHSLGFPGLGLKTGSYDLAHKITAMVFWFVPQKQVGYGLSVASQNRQDDKDGAGHTQRSSGWLRLEASWARISQSSLKTGVGVAWMVHVASS
jgi:hypothetical protein